MEQSLTSAFQKVLLAYRFPKKDDISPGEKFAQKRFLAKLELPDEKTSLDRQQRCWSDFIEFDSSLPSNLRLLPQKWYLARLLIHKWLKKFTLVDDIEFPVGSSFEPTLGYNSIAAYIGSHKWTCTPEAFDDFVILCYGHKALKRSVRRRFHRWIAQKGFDRKEVYSKLFSAFGGNRLKIFSWQMSQIVHLVRGSRFSTVPKNNLKDRPINIEPFGNLLLQRRIGNSIRKTLSLNGLDLDHAADVHRLRISNLDDATIDLKNASDSITVELCRFLFPKRFMELLERSRSFMLFGQDKMYHVPKKISAMGNGFTFELMSMILYAICQVYDEKSSVFGDDIIINKDFARSLISDIESVGFVVNEEKSFIDGPFRESCGANFHSECGYIESYDFKYPSSIGDCIVIFNKASRLSTIYPSFKPLVKSLGTHIPSALRGGSPLVNRDEFTFSPHSDIPLSCCFGIAGEGIPRLNVKYSKAFTNRYQLSDPVTFHFGYEFVNSLRKPTRRTLRSKSDWDTFEMYLHSGRVSKDVVRGEGRWVRKVYVYYNGKSRRFSPKELTSQ